ncbi:MAG: hypothetical protein WC023_01480 [Rhodocyclaceae bacterium]
MTTSKDLAFVQGKTFALVLRWATEPIVRKAISAITTPTGAARLTVPAHGIPDGWDCAVVSAKGMTEINAADPNDIRDGEYTPATVIDANTVELNKINAAGFKAYTSSGFLQYNTPVSLAGFTARMKIKDKIGGTVLASTDVGDTPLDILTITIDDAAKTITLGVAATATDDLTWTKGVYDLEMVSATGVVTALLSGKVSVSKEVTT